MMCVILYLHWFQEHVCFKDTYLPVLRRIYPAVVGYEDHCEAPSGPVVKFVRCVLRPRTFLRHRLPPSPERSLRALIRCDLIATYEGEKREMTVVEREAKRCRGAEVGRVSGRLSRSAYSDGPKTRAMTRVTSRVHLSVELLCRIYILTLRTLSRTPTRKPHLPPPSAKKTLSRDQRERKPSGRTSPPQYS